MCTNSLDSCAEQLLNKYYLHLCLEQSPWPNEHLGHLSEALRVKDAVVSIYASSCVSPHL